MKIKKFVSLILIFIFYSFVLIASEQIPAPTQKQPIALTNCTIHPVVGDVIQNGTIIFEKGKITELGKNVPIPDKALVKDLNRKHVYPAFIECYSIIGLTEIGAVKPMRDYAEIGEINSNVRAEVAVNPESEIIPVTRANGIALAVTLPVGGIIAGKSALIKLDGWTWEDMTLKAPVSMIMNWPRMEVITSRWMRQSQEEQRKEIKKRLAKLEKVFEEARAYKIAHETAQKQDIQFHKYDARLDALIPVLKGKLPIWIVANSLLQIEAAINWADRQKVKMVLVGGRESTHVTELLKRKNIPVIITSILRLPGRRDADFDEAFTLPLKLYEAGVKFCIASGGASKVRNLPYHAAKAASYGLPKNEALKAITQYPAEIIGIADQIGTLEKGKDATLMITNGDPLEIVTQVEGLYIQGSKIDLNNKHKTLYEKYKERYRQLKEVSQ